MGTSWSERTPTKVRAHYTRVGFKSTGVEAVQTGCEGRRLIRRRTDHTPLEKFVYTGADIVDKSIWRLTSIPHPPLGPVQRWQFQAQADDLSWVFPDGCLDVLVVECAETGTRRLRVTDWDHCPRHVTVTKGTSMTGFRLRPGVSLSLADHRREAAQLDDLQTYIQDRAEASFELAEVIEAISLTNVPIAQIAKSQGVSERTLQRHFQSKSLPNPMFWRQLGRARRAAQSLLQRHCLLEVAMDHGYSDQAHMTREFKRWFGCCPSKTLKSPYLLRDLAQPGLGNWRG